MSIDNFVKKRMFLFSLSLVCILFVAVSASYAFSVSPNADTTKIYNNDVEIEFVTGDNISSNYPMTYNEGSTNAKENIIRFKNTTTEKRDFNLYIENMVNENGIDLNKIYYKINDELPRKLGETNDPIYSGKLGSKKSEEVKIRIWVSSELVTNLDQGKVTNLKFTVK